MSIRFNLSGYGKAWRIENSIQLHADMTKAQAELDELTSLPLNLREWRRVFISKVEAIRRPSEPASSELLRQSRRYLLRHCSACLCRRNHRDAILGDLEEDFGKISKGTAIGAPASCIGLKLCTASGRCCGHSSSGSAFGVLLSKRLSHGGSADCRQTMSQFQTFLSSRFFSILPV